MSRTKFEQSTKRRQGSSDSDPESKPALEGWQARVVSRSLERATKRSIDRARAFIDATLQLLREPEGDGFTVQQVADRANLSLRTLYQHFGSKSDLLLAVFEEEEKRHAADIKGQVDKYQDELERLAAFLVAGATTVVKPTNELVVLTKYRLNLQQTHPEELAAVQAPVVDLARQLIIDAMTAGTIPQGDPDPLAYMMVTLKSSFLHSRILGNELGVTLPSPLQLAEFCIGGAMGELPKGFRQLKSATGR